MMAAMTIGTFRGVIAPILTPFNDDLSVATDLYIAHAGRMFAEGCAAIAPFGTTGEALSVGIDERIDAIRALIDAGLDPARMVPGTGLCNLADTARLSRACLDLGCPAVMTLPPFYYKGVTDDGLFRYFATLIEALGDGARIVLYHIPPVAVVGISPALAKRLHGEFPRQVVAIKDSSGDWENTKALFDIDGLVVYPGAELPLIDALELGGPGCITATANVNAKAIAEVVRRFDAGDRDGAREAHEDVRRVRLTIQEYAPIPAQKHLLARSTGDARWANVRPPLMALSDEDGAALAAALS
jgi:4-hydroxy-tetrahydrodipicolinate synthase